MSDAMEGFFFGVVVSLVLAGLFYSMWSVHATHDISHNVCMIVDDKNSVECINGTKILEILRQKR